MKNTDRKKGGNYLSMKDSNRIAKENRKITRELEKKRTRKYIPEEEYVTEMKNPENIVEFDNVHTYFYTDAGVAKAVNGVTFGISKGKTIGIVGESGCGKSVTSLSLMQLLQRPSGQVVEGAIRFNTGEQVVDVTKIPLDKMCDIRGNQLSMIFQEPMTTLNPVFKIGEQIDEVIELHRKDMSKEEIKARSIELLDMVGMIDPEAVYKKYPHELSGGMRQRVVIAMSLACDPKLIIADEPTTALDVTIQAQILDMLVDLKERINSSIMLITHDLGVVYDMADYVVVMYAGKVIEKGTRDEIFNNPCHPYTIGLMKSRPTLGQKVDRLFNIPGNVPNPINMPDYCYFKDRCDRCNEKCNGEYPKEIFLSPTHMVTCYNIPSEQGGEF